VERACARARRPPASPRRSRRLRRRARPEPFGPSFARRRQPPPSRTGGAIASSPTRLPLRRGGPRGKALSGLAGASPDEALASSDVETGRDADVNRAPSGGVDGHQPRFHGPGAGMLCCQRLLARGEARAVSRIQSFRTRSPAHGHPCGRLGEASIPTRSARTPLVVRPRHRRMETPTLPGATPVREPRLRRSHHTSPTPAKGRSPRARSPRAYASRLRVDTPHGRTSRPGCEARLESGAKGRITRASAKKNGIRRTRGAFHRRDRPPAPGRIPSSGTHPDDRG
jgi:hypothetical protein